MNCSFNLILTNLYPELVCKASPIWHDMFSSDVKLELNYEHIEANIFRLLERWIHGHDLGISNAEKVNIAFPGRARKDREERGALRENLDEEDSLLVGLWLVAEQLVIPALQTTVMKHLQKRWESVTWHWKGVGWPRERASEYKPNGKWIRFAWENTTEGPLRQLALIQGMFFLDSNDFKADLTRLPTDEGNSPMGMGDSGEEEEAWFPRSYLLELARQFSRCAPDRKMKQGANFGSGSHREILRVLFCG